MGSSRTAHARKGRALSPVDANVRRKSRRRSVAAIAMFGILTGAIGFGYLGGGKPLARAVELSPECEAYDELVTRCFPRPTSKATNHHRTIASKEVCASRVKQLKEVCQ